MLRVGNGQGGDGMFTVSYDSYILRGAIMSFETKENMFRTCQEIYGQWGTRRIQMRERERERVFTVCTMVMVIVSSHECKQ